jgi:peptidoglycan/LPS O-acetylase OafA/YrhL
MAQWSWTDDISRRFLSWQFPAFLPEFGLGMSLANWWAYRQQKPASGWVQLFGSPQAAWGYTIAGVVLMCLALNGYSQYLGINYVTADYYTLNPVAATAAGLLIVGALHSGQVLRSVFGFLPLRIFGIIGYSVFLWHLPIIHIVRNYPIFKGPYPVYLGATPLRTFEATVALVLVMVSVLGVIFYQFIERPFIENRPKQDQ